MTDQTDVENYFLKLYSENVRLKADVKRLTESATGSALKNMAQEILDLRADNERLKIRGDNLFILRHNAIEQLIELRALLADTATTLQRYSTWDEPPSTTQIGDLYDKLHAALGEQAKPDDINVDGINEQCEREAKDMRQHYDRLDTILDDDHNQG